MASRFKLHLIEEKDQYRNETEFSIIAETSSEARQEYFKKFAGSNYSGGNGFFDNAGWYHTLTRVEQDYSRPL